MKKLHFAYVRDITEWADGKYLLDLRDIKTDFPHFTLIKLTDDERDYLLDVGSVPYIFEKYKERWHVIPLMPTNQIGPSDGEVVSNV